MPAMRESPIYLIVGAPRSGTSVLALILKEQGIPMYIGADAPDQDSPSGNQEDNLARLVNNSLMGRNGLGHRRDWDNPSYVRAATSTGLSLVRAYVATRSRIADGSSWGMKDPRLCFTIELWHAATRSLPVRWIHIRRENRKASVMSLIGMLPAKLRLSGESDGLYHLASSWLESYHIASELGFERTGIEPYAITYEELLTPSGRDALHRRFGFERPITCVNPKLNRRGRTPPNQGSNHEKH
jgi:hypothetical protein